MEPTLQSLTSTATSTASNLLRRVRRRRTSNGSSSPTAAITVHRPLDEVYAALGAPGLLERMVPGLTEEVTESGAHRYSWKGEDGAAETAEYRITFDHPENSVIWTPSDPPGPLPRGGLVCSAAPGGWGTEVHVQIDEVEPVETPTPADQEPAALTPDRLVHDGLRRLKQVLEIGEVVQADLRSADRSPGQKRRTDKMSDLLRTGGRP